MKQHHLERLSSQLPARRQCRQVAAHALVDIGERTLNFVVLIEDVCDERIGLNRGIRLSLQLSLHVSLSLSSPARAADRLAGFAFGFFLAFGFAPVVEFLPARNRKFALCNAVSKIDLQGDDSHALLLYL